MGIGDKQVVDEIVFLGRRGLFAAPAAFLRPVVRQGLRLEITTMGKGHHHIFRGDQILHAQILRIHHNFAAPLIAELLAGTAQFLNNHGSNAFGSWRE